jgi:hypothetical protein
MRGGFLLERRAGRRMERPVPEPRLDRLVRGRDVGAKALGPLGRHLRLDLHRRLEEVCEMGLRRPRRLPGRVAVAAEVDGDDVMARKAPTSSPKRPA